MAFELSSAGIIVSYGIETTAGTFPTAFTKIPGIKSIPAFGEDVNTLQTTPLEETVNHTYIAGLKDNGGSLALKANLTEAFANKWATFVSSAATAISGGKKAYIQFEIPGLNMTLDTSSVNASYFIPVEPVALGFGGVEVDSVVEITANLIPVGSGEWKTRIAGT